MELLQSKSLPPIPKLKLAVVGHVEWVSFLSVDKCPREGTISHGKIYLEEPAGGGAVSAVKLAKLIGEPVDFFTALGNDLTGKKCFKKLSQLGLNLNVAWKDEPTRKAISMINRKGERAITVIGDRLQPSKKDKLPWQKMNKYDGVFLTAVGSDALSDCREANVLVATPRLGLGALEEKNIKLDAIIGSSLDPDENMEGLSIKPAPRILITTKGSLGGESWPGGPFKAFKLNSPLVDTYGCGDNFAAGVTAGLAAGWSIQQAISLGSQCGAECATHLGPYDH
ncbi:PfkB family carbohydrate kinase [Prochlorococcus sp. MIT 1307]|uniref:PfkB family carbohydrate kinase n=1 Tax=Prochlorococcus sp. MIT 1307 TaxID=3096219 RepID=UPI002A763EDC|nr:PfkB family carbohydrate kinase [Prochlorococcus sp. MIT 1307]